MSRGVARTTLVGTLTSAGLLVALVHSYSGAPSRVNTTTRLSENVAITANGTGRPLINFADGRDLITTYVGSANATRSLEQTSLKPLSLASADFDEDGVPDLVAGYATGGGSGVIVIHRGSIEALYPSGSGTPQIVPSPFLSPALALDCQQRPDFIGAGDFDADGHCDLIVGTRGASTLSLLRGTGGGGFEAEERIELPGAVTALKTGEVDSADGLADIAVAVRRGGGPALMIFKSPEGAARAQARIVELPDEGRAIAIGSFFADATNDVAIGAGSTLFILRGAEAQSPESQGSERLALGGTALDIAAGDFAGDGKSGLAVLVEGGAVKVLQHKSDGWQKQSTPVNAGGATRILAARVSSESCDQIVAIDPAMRALGVASAKSALRESFAVDGEPVAVLPMRLNADALSDLVVLRRGAVAPAALITIASSTFTVTTTNDSGVGSLRDAIDKANMSPGADMIVFNIGSGTPTINVGSGGLGPLSTITDAVTIEGATGGATRVELNGSLAGAANGLDVLASNCALRSLVINRFNQAGINLRQLGGDIVENCFIGTNSSGTAALGNGFGVTVTSPGNRIGGSAAPASNVISGNGGAGVRMTALGSANTVSGNFIGVNANGSAAVPNNDNGVTIVDGPTNTVVGGTTPGSRNIISGNALNGVAVSNANTNQIQANLIGTNASGSAAIPNAFDGVTLFSAGSNLVGGTTPAARNIISGNAHAGVSILASLTGNNQLQGNFIGTNSTGTAAVPNGQSGIRLDTALSEVIGGAAGAGNVISGNSGPGLLFTMGSNSCNVAGNLIGTQVDGVSALGNAAQGVFFLDPGFNNMIGGTAGNVVAFNNVAGISIAGTGNAISGNSIFSNAGPGIDLGADGVSPNDACDADGGANNTQNFPDLTQAQTTGASLTVTGALNSTPTTTFRVEFFASPTCDASGNGEGKTFLGATIVSTNAACVGPVSVTLPVSVPVGNVVTATATDPSHNTSEFSACVVVTGAPCAISCPADLVLQAAADQCGAVPNYPDPTILGACGGVLCTPPRDSLFPVGATKVNCVTGGGPACSFLVSVLDATAPKITCPANITAALPTGQQGVVVDYVIATATDNCPGASVICLPPSGVVFPAGVSTVTCTTSDAAGNMAICIFTVTVSDSTAPTIQCPPGVTVNAAPGQSSAIVSYPPPTVSDNLPGATASCVPPSGSSFAAGITTVACVATDAAGNKASCGFLVTVNGGPPIVRLIIPAGKTSIEFPTRPARRKPPDTLECQQFIIENAGSSSATLTLDSIQRTAPNIDRLANRDDSALFPVSVVNADQSETPLPAGTRVTVGGGQQRSFCVRFNPLIPPVAGATTGLQATDVIPDRINSSFTFTVPGVNSIVVPLIGNVETAVVFIRPNKPKKPAVFAFEKSGDRFTVTHSNYDSNSDVRQARYEFLDSSSRAVQDPLDVDLSQAIRDRSLVRGQSFSVVSEFSGAGSHPEVTQVRLTVFDGETSISATIPLQGSAASAANQLLKRSQRATFYVRALRITPSGAE